MKALRVLLAASVTLAFLGGCGGVQSQSAQRTRTRPGRTPSPREVEATLNRFEAAFREKRFAGACRFLTPRALRELVASHGKDPGHMTSGMFKKCPLYLRILTKGVRIPRVHVIVENLGKEAFRHRLYLIAYPPKGPSVVLNSAGTRIVILAGPERE